MTSLTNIQLLRRNRPFRQLWLGQVVSELGNWFNFIAALGLVRLVSDKAAGPTTILLVVRMVPFTLMAPLAGACVDRWSRRTVMIVSDLIRVAIALSMLLVSRAEDLWIAYSCTFVLSFFGTFFEAAKNAAVPSITGDRDLLAGNSLMWSSRFLLMSLGAAMGGWTAAHFGYRAAFIINSISFLVSAWSVWLIPEDVVRTAATGNNQPEHRSYWSDIREGWAYIVAHGPVAAILLINIIWATGGGAINLICDRLGGVVFAGQHGIDGDSAVAAFYFANGLGLLIGMLIARRVGSQMELLGRTVAFIGWMLILQGVVLALMGLMPSLVLACVMLLVSRTVLGVEFAVQDTLLMRLVPDNLRGRVITTDRASELLLWSFSTTIAGWSLSFIVPRTLTIISGLLSGTAGVVWLLLFAFQRVRLPKRFTGASRSADGEFVSAAVE